MRVRDAVVRGLLRYRALALVALAVTTAWAGWRVLYLDFDFSFRSFFIEGRETDDFTIDLERRLGNTGGSTLVAVLRGDDVFRRDVLAAVQAMSDALAVLPHVDQVYGLATVPFVFGDGDAVSTQPAATLVEDGADPAAVRGRMLASPVWTRRLVSADGTTTAVAALLDPAHQGVAPRAPTLAAFQAAVTAHLPPGFTATYTGYPFAEAEYARLVWKGFMVAEAAGIALMAVLLYLCFGTLAGVCLPLVTVGLATVLTLGMMETLGQAITFTNASVPLLVLVIGIGEVSFLLARYYEEAEAGGEPRAVVERATAAVLEPGLIAAATTSAGFASLATGHIGLTRDLGVALAGGILLTFAVGLVLVPAVLASLPLRGRTEHGVLELAIARLLRAVAAVNLRHRAAVGIGAVLVLGIGLAGATRVSVAQFALTEVPATNPIRTAEALVDTTLSGTFQTMVGLRRADGGPMTAPEALRGVAALGDFLARQEHVVKTWSVADYLAELHAATHGGDVAYRRVPDDAALVDQYLLLLASGGSASELGTLLDPGGRIATVVAGTTDLGTAELQAIRDRVAAFLTTLPGPRLEFRFAGDYWQVSLGADSLIRDLFVSTLTSFLFVFALVALWLRSWRLTLLSIPPNILPLVAALGVMGFAGIALRVGTSIILPGALGIAVDATVHCLARYREEWARDGSYEAAMERTLLGTGRGMVFSALVLVLGFLCFLAPEFLVFKHIGILGSATLAVASLADLFLTPSLVLWFRPLGRMPAPTAAAAAVRRTATEG